jgi:catalase
MTTGTDWKETVEKDEAEKFERFATILADLQKARGGKMRALHAKQHVGLKAEVEVLADLPEHLRVGPFKESKKYDAYVRFSNGSGTKLGDDKPDVRAIAIKILGVPGKKLIPGMEDETTQDFLMLNTPALAFRSVDEFVFFAQASTSQALLPFRLFAKMGFGMFGFLKRLLASAKKVDSLATQKYFTVAAVRFGAHAARLSLAPKQTDGGRNGATLRDDVLARLEKGPLEWELCAQLFVKDDVTPIEDTSREWSEEASKPIPIAKLVIREKEPVDELVESMAFDPWHAVEDLRPLGAAMRARGPAYRESQKTRGAAKEPR